MMDNVINMINSNILDSLNGLDENEQKSFDDLVTLATKLCGSKHAFIGFFQNNSLFLVSKNFESNVVLELNEATKEVLSEPPRVIQMGLGNSQLEQFRKLNRHTKFLASIALVYEKEIIGVFVIIDENERKLSLDEQSSLSMLANLSSQQVEKKIHARQYKELLPKICNVSKCGLLNEKDSNISYLNSLFESVQEAANIGVWELNLDNQKVFWSNRVYDIHEIERGRPIYIDDGINYYHEDYQDIIKEAVNNGIKYAKSWDYELLLVTDKGNERWVRAIGIPMEENGQVVRLRGIFQDIDDKKRITLKNKTIQNRLELFVKHTPAAVAMFDRNMCYLLASKRWYEDYGLEGKTIIGSSHYEIFPEILNMPKWLHDHKKALAGEVVKHDHDRFEREDGSIQWLKYEIYPWYDTDDNIGGIGMFTEDITEERELTETLKREESKFRSMIESSAIGIATVSSKGHFISANNALVEILGYTKEELTKKTFQELTHPDDLETDIDKVNQILRLEISSYEMEKRYYHKNGKVIWAQLNVSAAYTESKEVDFFISQIQDISIRKKVDEEKKSMHELLERNVAKRTIELQASNRELEAFSYSVSHDLRSPLRSINGFSKALKDDYDDKLDKVGKNYLERISKAAIRMGGLIDDLLDLSKISRKDLLFQEIDITELCQTLVKSLQVDPKYIISIEKNLTAVGDTALISIMMENMIGNAIKYSSKVEQPLIEIGKTKDSAFYIKDNGAGFNSEYADKLFGAFQRLHSSNEFEGTGIGLATVQRIINKHGGKIWAESQVDKGATFYFIIGDE